MRNRFGLERRDFRNLLVVVAVVGSVMAITTDAPIAARIIVGLVLGVVSGATFLVLTALINRYRPEY